MYRNFYHIEGDKPQKIQDLKDEMSNDQHFGFIEHSHEDHTYMTPLRCGGDSKEGVGFCQPMYPNDMIENNSTANNKEY